MRKDPVILFTCRPEDEGVIASPVPAKSLLPDWFRKLPAIDRAHLSATNNGLTAKRCMPFFDALATGWILPLAATVRLEIADGGRTVHAGWEFDRTMVSNHSPPQVAGNPMEPRPPCKFHNHWTIRTAKGWSCLFLPPLNRPNPVFQCVAGIVDTDSYASPVHLPFFATGPDGVHVIERGTPLVQVIPFRRADAAIGGEVRAETAEEATIRERILRQTMAADGWYRREARAAR
ncbi:DUF6065 family protein [Elioraea tepidiphila]|mgnify:FL=1|jgi:hypothetical protein|uniref:DUF6065 family protein n=1 Tax=Elioraea tepidiphila TaxID=457934 RepID=UPI002FD9281D